MSTTSASRCRAQAAGWRAAHLELRTGLRYELILDGTLGIPVDLVTEAGYDLRDDMSAAAAMELAPDQAGLDLKDQALLRPVPGLEAMVRGAGGFGVSGRPQKRHKDEPQVPWLRRHVYLGSTAAAPPRVPQAE